MDKERENWREKDKKYICRRGIKYPLNYCVKSCPVKNDLSYSLVLCKSEFVKVPFKTKFSD